MAQDTDAERLAAYLRMLKERTGRSFDALGRRAGVSGSSLHRYCAGKTVPSGFGSMLAFAKACGATKGELRELQRLWVLADARRDASESVRDRRARPPLPGVAAPGGDPADDNALPPGGDPADDNALPPGSDLADNDNAPLRDNPADDQVPGGDQAVGAARARLSMVALLAIGAVVVLLGAAVWPEDLPWSGHRPKSVADADADADGRLLFSPACRQAIGQGQNDECVREVQRLLKAAGGRLAVDGNFGPETLRRVTAFQALAGLSPRGIVDDATKHALYDRKASMETWPAARVEQRIRQVFAAEPERAVAIADCQSYLDPQWVQPNPNGTRNWGVFQIADVRLRQFKATPSQALDPEWNIQAAYRLWKVRPDFADWPSCARATGIRPSPVTAPG